MSSDPTDNGRDRNTGQFRPGHSGNPTGGRQTAKTVDDSILKALDTPLMVTEGGRKRKRAARDVIAQQMANDGARGNLSAGKTAMEMGRRAEQAKAQGGGAADELSASDLEITERVFARIRLIIEQEKEDSDELPVDEK